MCVPSYDSFISFNFLRESPASCLAALLIEAVAVAMIEEEILVPTWHSP
jgi:hypothetical protein